jgi:predicted metalloprotease with PDZ domain
MTEQLQKAFGTEGGQGVLVAGVEQEAAGATAGLQAGDVLVAIAGNPITGTRDVKHLLRQFHPGDTVQLDVVREREPMQVEVVLGAAPKQAKWHPRHKYHHPGHGFRHHGWKHDRWHGMPRHHCMKRYPRGS